MLHDRLYPSFFVPRPGFVVEYDLRITVLSENHPEFDPRFVSIVIAWIPDIPHFLDMWQVGESADIVPLMNLVTAQINAFQPLHAFQTDYTVDPIPSEIESGDISQNGRSGPQIVNNVIGEVEAL